MAAFGWPSGGINPDVTEGGIVLMGQIAFTNRASVSLDNCFTSRFSDYLFRAVVTATTGVDATIRLRRQGVDASGTDYSYQLISANGTGVSGLRTTSTTSWRIGTVNTTTSSVDISIYRPALNETTRGYAFLGSSFTTVTIENSAYHHGLATAYDGVTLAVPSGTITGYMRVYGYKGASA